MREYYKPEIPKKEEAETEEAYNKRYQNYLENSDINKIEHTGEKKRNRYHHGFIAQEVETLIQNTGIDFGGYQDHSISGGSNVKTIGYDELIAPMVKAIQELTNRIETLESRNG